MDGREGKEERKEGRKEGDKRGERRGKLRINAIQEERVKKKRGKEGKVMRW